MRAMSSESGASLSRTLRCPKCRQQFETMRRFRLACPECGHEWAEESHLTASDKLADARSQIGEYLFMLLSWAILLAFIAMVLAIFVIGAVRATERGGLATGLTVVAIFVVIIVAIAGFTRRNMEIAERNVWWVPRWRGRRDD
jgi:hypothetical protein